MERIYNFNQGLPQPPANERSGGSPVKLHKGHLWIEAGLAAQVFGGAQQAYAVYYDNMGALLLAPETDQLFRQSHEVIMLMIKTKNMAGDKSISLQEFFADHDLDGADRDLEFMSAPGLSMIQVKLK